MMKKQGKDMKMKICRVVTILTLVCVVVIALISCGKLLALEIDSSSTSSSTSTSDISDTSDTYDTSDTSDTYETSDTSDYCSGSDNIINTVFLNNGVINGTNLDASNRTITVSNGDSITGTVTVTTNNGMGSGAVTVFGGVYNWGDRTTSFWEDNQSVATGNNQYNMAINLTAPNIIGEYFIAILFEGEFSIEQAVSATNWSAPAVVWNDHNDIFGLGKASFYKANILGAVAVDYQYTNQYKVRCIGMTTIKVIVI